MTAASKVQVKPLTGSVGAAITGVKLKDIDDADLAVVRKAFLDHCMLVFPNQFLAPEDQFAFAQRWGRIMIYPGIEYPKDLPHGILQFSNDGKDKVITENWHFDGMYYPVPPSGSILVPQRLPKAGGDTMWSNQYLAYETLSDGLKQLLAGLKCYFETHRVVKKYEFDKSPSAIQPAVRKHPETGRLALYVGNPDSCLNFVGMKREESEPLIRYLYNHSFRPDRVYRHMWKDGDVVMWDNRCTMHYAVHDYGNEPRDMYRITFEGDPARGPLDA